MKRNLCGEQNVTKNKKLDVENRALKGESELLADELKQYPNIAKESNKKMRKIQQDLGDGKNYCHEVDAPRKIMLTQGQTSL